MTGARARVATWNTGWLAPRGRSRSAAITTMSRWSADVLVLTEVDLALLSELGGHIATGGTDWGYRRTGRRHKVALWSPHPWRDVDNGEHTTMPGGRYVSATTTTLAGDLRIVGVCIPWRAAHVSTGREDRLPWEDHLAYLEALPAQLQVESTRGPLVLAGDLNQTVPASTAPSAVRIALEEALAGLTVVTAGQGCGRPLLDHIAIGPGLRAASARSVCLAHTNGPLSDHDASCADITAAGD